MKNILAAVDFSAAVPDVLREAEGMARLLGAKLTLLHVAAPEPDFIGYEPGPQAERDLVARHLHEEHRQLQQLADGVRARGIEATALLVQGPTGETIVKEAAKVDAVMIVIGSHGHGAVYHLLVGSVGRDVLHHSLRPVLVVPTHKGRRK